MSSRLEELFNLPPSEERHSVVLTEEQEIVSDSLEILDKIEEALPTVRGLESADRELDEISSMAIEGFKGLSDLAYNVDSRYSAELFNAASSLMGHAITAKTAKINKKLKMLDLQLKKAELDRKIQSAVPKEEEPGSEEKGLASMDRNELLKSIISIKKG